MNTIELKWKLTSEQIEADEAQVIGVTRIVTKAQAEKEAKANGLWDYRNNKIVEE